MAKSPNAPSIDPEQLYQVKLTRTVKVGRISVHPGPNVQLRGDILAGVREESGDAVASFKPVEPKVAG